MYVWMYKNIYVYIYIVYIYYIYLDFDIIIQERRLAKENSELQKVGLFPSYQYLIMVYMFHLRTYHDIPSFRLFFLFFIFHEGDLYIFVETNIKLQHIFMFNIIILFSRYHNK